DPRRIADAPGPATGERATERPGGAHRAELAHELAVEPEGGRLHRDAPLETAGGQRVLGGEVDSRDIAGRLPRRVPEAHRPGDAGAVGHVRERERVLDGRAGELRPAGA